jgi:hypothetical protein
MARYKVPLRWGTASHTSGTTARGKNSTRGVACDADFWPQVAHSELAPKGGAELPWSTRAKSPKRVSRFVIRFVIWIRALAEADKGGRKVPSGPSLPCVLSLAWPLGRFQRAFKGAISRAPRIGAARFPAPSGRHIPDRDGGSRCRWHIESPPAPALPTCQRLCPLR